MKTVISALAIIFITASCKKSDKTPVDVLQGVWVETSLRQDTLDFTINQLIDNSSGYEIVNFNSAPYNDPVLNPNFPVNHSSMYNYYLDSGAAIINLRSFFSSSTAFQRYKFTMSSAGNRFTVEKFYGRRSLPSSIEFVRIR